MNRAKSIDLPTVVEEVSVLSNDETLSYRKSPPSSNVSVRPKSADSILCHVGKKHRNKTHQKSVGRFS